MLRTVLVGGRIGCVACGMLSVGIHACCWFEVSRVGSNSMPLGEGRERGGVHSLTVATF
jgi:hypothetical protein